MEKHEPQVQRAKSKEEGKTQQVIQEMAKKLKEQDFVARNTLIVEEEKLLQYAKLIIETAKKAERNTYPLLSMKSGVFRWPVM